MPLDERFSYFISCILGNRMTNLMTFLSTTIFIIKSMPTHMSGFIRKQYKVFNAIIKFIAIDMMNNLLRFKQSAKMFLYNQCLFSNTFTIFATFRMIRFKYTFISVNYSKKFLRFIKSTVPGFSSRFSNFFRCFSGKSFIPRRKTKPIFISNHKGIVPSFPITWFINMRTMIRTKSFCYPITHTLIRLFNNFSTATDTFFSKHIFCLSEKSILYFNSCVNHFIML